MICTCICSHSSMTLYSVVYTCTYTILSSKNQHLRTPQFTKVLVRTRTDSLLIKPNDQLYHILYRDTVNKFDEMLTLKHSLLYQFIQ